MPDTSLMWQQDPSGLWYIKSLQESFQTYKVGGKPEVRFRAVMMYAKFDPNAKVDPKFFAVDRLELPANSQAIDNRTEGKVIVRQAR